MSIGTPTTIKNITIGGDQPGTLTLKDDWSYIDDTKCSYIAANHLTVSGFSANEFISVGDPIRIKQGGSTKYFYAVAVSGTGFQVNGGSDYTFNSDAITEVRRGIKNNPTDFPFIFNWDPNIQASSGSFSNLSSAFQTAKFRIDGSTCIMMINVDFASTTAATSLYFTPPVRADFEASEPNMTIIVSDNGSILQGYMKFGAAAITEVGTWKGGPPPTLSTFAINTNTLGFSAQFIYLIDVDNPNI